LNVVDQSAPADHRQREAPPCADVQIDRSELVNRKVAKFIEQVKDGNFVAGERHENHAVRNEVDWDTKF
jgi:hypothetical protein